MNKIIETTRSISKPQNWQAIINATKAEPAAIEKGYKLFASSKLKTAKSRNKRQNIIKGACVKLKNDLRWYSNSTETDYLNVSAPVINEEETTGAINKLTENWWHNI